LEITSLDLGINFRKGDIELEEGIEDNRYSRSLDISIDDNFETGIYPITINSYYDVDDLSDTKTINLEVQECKAITSYEEEEEDKEVVFIQSPESDAQPEDGQEEQGTFRESPAYIALLAIGFIVLLGAIIFVFFVLL